MLHGRAVQRVQHGVPCAVCRRAAAVGLPAAPKVEGLPAKGALVDLALVGAGEGQPIVLQLVDGSGGLLAHVLNCVLVAQPVAALDGVVRVPPPVVLCRQARAGAGQARAGSKQAEEPSTPPHQAIDLLLPSLPKPCGACAPPRQQPGRCMLHCAVLTKGRLNPAHLTCCPALH